VKSGFQLGTRFFAIAGCSILAGIEQRYTTYDRRDTKMSFRFYSNAVSQASRNFAAGIFVVGLMLIGFGFLIYILRDLFAVLFAGVFCLAGVGCGITAFKIFLFQRRIDQANPSDPYRENVRIHIEEHREE
jgi:hypothetical protein